MDEENKEEKMYVGQKAITDYQQTGLKKGPVPIGRLINQTRGETSFQKEAEQIQKAKSKKTT